MTWWRRSWRSKHARALANWDSFAAVVLETTGLADAPILDTLMSIIDPPGAFASTALSLTADAVNGSGSMDRQHRSGSAGGGRRRILLDYHDDLRTSAQLPR